MYEYLIRAKKSTTTYPREEVIFGHSYENALKKYGYKKEEWILESCWYAD